MFGTWTSSQARLSDRMYLGPPKQHSGHFYRAAMTMTVTGSTVKATGLADARKYTAAYLGVVAPTSTVRYGADSTELAL